jgi:hypothetical protein
MTWNLDAVLFSNVRLVLHMKMLDSIASETPIFFKVKWLPGYIFA